jgi:hypothetical protein
MLEHAALPAPSLGVVARASTQRRCADAYLHELRGSFQALFGALELLCRVAKGAGDNAERADKACELARRAIRQHEKTTLDLFQLLTFQSAEVCELDLRALADEMVHLFRNDVATRDLALHIHGSTRPVVRAEHSALHAAVATLLWVAIDSSPAGTDLRMGVEEEDGRAVLTIEPVPGISPRGRTAAGRPPGDAAAQLAPSADLLIAAVHQYLSANGGELTYVTVGSPQRNLRVTLPLSESPAASPNRDGRQIPAHDTAAGRSTR